MKSFRCSCCFDKFCAACAVFSWHQLKGNTAMLSKEYTTLFNAITTAIDILKAAQIEAEELFISRQESEPPFATLCHEHNTHCDMSCAYHRQSVPMFQTENNACKAQKVGQGFEADLSQR